MALKGAPGRDGPASGNDSGSGVVMQGMETVGKCRVGVERSAGSRKGMRNTWIPNRVGGGRLKFTRLYYGTLGLYLHNHNRLSYKYTLSHLKRVHNTTTRHSEDGTDDPTANSRTFTRPMSVGIDVYL